VLIRSYGPRDSHHWQFDLQTGSATPIDEAKDYIVLKHANGVETFEVVSLDYPVLNQYTQKDNLSVSPGEKYVIFKTQIEGREYLKVVPI